MGFRSGAYATIWSVEDKGKYSTVSLSTSKKNKESGDYVTDFSSKFVSFIGKAHEMAQDLAERDRVKIGECEVTRKWDKEKEREYINYNVYSFEIPEPYDGNKKSGGESSDDELPY